MKATRFPLDVGDPHARAGVTIGSLQLRRFPGLEELVEPRPAYHTDARGLCTHVRPGPVCLKIFERPGIRKGELKYLCGTNFESEIRDDQAIRRPPGEGPVHAGEDRPQVHPEQAGDPRTAGPVGGQQDHTAQLLRISQADAEGPGQAPDVPGEGARDGGLARRGQGHLHREEGQDVLLSALPADTWPTTSPARSAAARTRT